MNGQQEKVDEKTASNLSTNQFLIIQTPQIGIANVIGLRYSLHP